MSKSESKPEAPKFATVMLLRSKALACYQQDFARAVLTESEYTIEEAKAAIEAVLKEV